MIKWTDIDNEVEEFQSGYKAGFVSIFKKYEGTDTDERSAQNKVVKVTVNSFARRYGIAEGTFKDWVAKEEGVVRHPDRPGLNDRMKQMADEAAAKAKAQAEAQAKLDLANALSRQKRELNLAESKRAAEAAAKIRKEEQAKAKEAAAKEIAYLKTKLLETAQSAEFDVSTMTEAQKAQVMTLLANDPEKAKEWFSAQTAERARKLAEQEKAARAAQAKKRQQMEERESRQAAEKAKKDYDSSALRKLLDLEKLAKECQDMLRSKSVNFDHILVSGKTAQEWINVTERIEDIAVEYREAIFDVNAKNELADLTE